MFKNLLDFLTSFPDFVNNKNILKDGKKRRKIARDFVTMLNIIDGLKENAIRVKKEIEDCIRCLREKKDCYMYTLCFILEEQVLYMQEIENILHGDWSYNPVFQIYGYNNNILHNIIDGKFHLVELMRASISTYPADIPMTFDLSEYADYISTIELEDGTIYQMPHYDMCYSYPDPMNIYNRIEKGEMRFTSKNRKKLLEHLEFLNNQMDKFDSVNKLEEARQKLAEIIRDNFSIEEIVYERETED